MKAGIAQAKHGVVLRRVAIVGSVVAGGYAIHHQLKKNRNVASQPPQQLRVHRPVVDALAGAFGEVCQVCILYPLETWRVRCQADGLGSLAVVRKLIAQYGLTPNLVSHLYAGFASAALFSCAVGAVHWLSFCAAKRTALGFMPPAPSDSQTKSRPKPAKQPAEQEAAAAASAAAAAGSAEDQSQHGHHHHLMISSSHHLHETDDNQEPGTPHDDLSNKTSANMFAAIVGALATALIESPVELFRHQAQAGLISGNLVAEMGRAVRGGGPGALWTGFLPFCLEAFPYDCSELGSYSQLRDVYDELSKPGGRFHAFCSRFPEHAWDLAIGGAAGAIAVLVSMPFDCIKTYMQTHDTGIAGASASKQVAAFFATGQRMVQTRGPGALFVGAFPRLVQQIPSSTICWWAVQQAQKFFEPYVVPDAVTAGAGAATGHGHGDGHSSSGKKAGSKASKAAGGASNDSK
mmetsp:Transcript_26483/g.67332  ORF Transcript_26483/g.67332 Transcript_26483/m.67332 type:complete len:462 (-) Transcript_26483:520-1905(-)|eukprot:CAMPEP_0202858596 /NCGR_PEP_ID=MMETSP1391-20130828/1057_1 /ASSEMBLY_ACC=CAM_ASM_000867 /TAXON_ID=1034604 /ORGANISM="Chlamydomonas leiostraca, Strain SAG 11-49" /LENGTH=461 /DNA_ID=CAMNT_0049537525 /DNA_START=69 /DNA_END=1454 /DNA_ORIENTATION=-